MQVLSTLAALLPLVTVALGQYNRYDNPQITDCSPVQDDPKVYWTDLGLLTQTRDPMPSPSDKFFRWDHKPVAYNHDTGYSHYWYGFYAGVDSLGRMYVQVDRDGKGQGQQFKVSFKMNDGRAVGTYWMTPGQLCKSPPGNIMAPAVTKIQVWNRNTG